MKQKLERLLANLFGVVFLGLSLLVTVETVLRKAFNFSLQGAAELGGYALAVGSAIGFALAITSRSHIRVDVFHERFPPALQAFMNWLSAVSLGALALFLVGVCWRVVEQDGRVRQRGADAVGDAADLPAERLVRGAGGLRGLRGGPCAARLSPVLHRPARGAAGRVPSRRARRRSSRKSSTTWRNAPMRRRVKHEHDRVRADLPADDRADAARPADRGVDGAGRRWRRRPRLRRAVPVVHRRDAVGRAQRQPADRRAAVHPARRTAAAQRHGRPHVRRDGGLAVAPARRAAAHQHRVLRAFRRDLGFIGRHRRDRGHRRAAVAAPAQVPDAAGAGHAGGRRHARHPDPAVDQHDRLRLAHRRTRSASCSSPA